MTTPEDVAEEPVAEPLLPPLEADPADAYEQAVEVELDEDDRR